MESTPGPDSLRNYFAGLAEFAFEMQLGVVDPPLVDYITGLLTRFSHFDGIYCEKNLFGRPLVQVSEMLAESRIRSGPMLRNLQRHIGDFTLFWSGLYPEALRQMQATSKADACLDYPKLGKLAYRVASTIQEGEQPGESALFERLSHDYELCLCGLTELRREWVKRDDFPQTF
jgi:hypothetical protein